MQSARAPLQQVCMQHDTEGSLSRVAGRQMELVQFVDIPSVHLFPVYAIPTRILNQHNVTCVESIITEIILTCNAARFI